MTIKAELKEKQIKASKSEPGTYQVDCPMPHCQKARKGKDDPTPLKLEIVDEQYAHWKCANCLHTGHIGISPEPKQDTSSPEDKITIPSASPIPQNAKKILQSVGVTDAVILAYRLRWDDERQAIRIPYDQFGEVTNMLMLNIPEMTSRLASSKVITFYGLESAKAAKPIIIVQRELDRLILASCGITNVLSLPNGGNLPARSDGEIDPSEYFQSASKLFTDCSQVIIAMDNTEQGQTFRYEIARRLGAAKCWNIIWGLETLSDTIKKFGTDYVCDDVKLAKPFPITGLYTVEDFQDSLMKYFDGGMAAGVSTQWDNVDKFYTVMPGEMTVVTGIPNSGKSEWVDALAVNLALAEGWRFAVFSPENGKEQHVTKLVEKRVEMSADPRREERMSAETFMSGAAWVSEHFYFIVGDDEKELPTLDWLMQKAAFAVLRYGIKGIILDPWNEIEHKRPSGISETEYISEALSKLKRFARNHGIHLWLVAHPGKLQRGKDGKYEAPGLYDISGSAHWANKTDNGIAIHREDEKTTTTDVIIRKVRFKHVGRKGIAYLNYSRVTGRYEKPQHGDGQGALFSQAGDGGDINDYGDGSQQWRGAAREY